jgi:hypothetical protein
MAIGLLLLSLRVTRNINPTFFFFLTIKEIIRKLPGR